jgi:hypothetical protein
MQVVEIELMVALAITTVAHVAAPVTGVFGRDGREWRRARMPKAFDAVEPCRACLWPLGALKSCATSRATVDISL